MASFIVAHMNRAADTATAVSLALDALDGFDVGYTGTADDLTVEATFARDAVAQLLPNLPGYARTDADVAIRLLDRAIASKCGIYDRTGSVEAALRRIEAVDAVMQRQNGSYRFMRDLLAAPAADYYARSFTAQTLDDVVTRIELLAAAHSPAEITQAGTPGRLV